jgi:hypothetical protein
MYFEVDPEILRWSLKQNRFLQRSQYLMDYVTNANMGLSHASISQANNSLPFNQTSDTARESIDTGDNVPLSTPHLRNVQQDLSADQPSPSDWDSGGMALDVWSAAYQEAVESLGKELTALNGKNAEQLFKELEVAGQETAHKSSFMRGVERLRSLKPSLDSFKLALDLASPLADLEPTASTVVGVLRSVTTVRLAHLL